MKSSMISRGGLTTVALAVAVVLAAVLFIPTRSHSNAVPTVDAVARGEYLVKNVAMCADCHTPRLADGRFDESLWLMGTELDFTPKHAVPGWVDVAPALAGLRGYDDAEAVALLSEGMLPGGKLLGAPMPQYRMSPQDAAAVVAYLRSLPAR